MADRGIVKRSMKLVFLSRAIFGELNGAHSLLASDQKGGPWQSSWAIDMDLPDSAPAGVLWRGFFRGWQQDAFYFFSRTEPDFKARRPGMVRAQVLCLALKDACQLTDISEILAELEKTWTSETCQVPFRLEVKPFDSRHSKDEPGHLLVKIAERLPRGDLGKNAPVVIGEETLRRLANELWCRLPAEMRCSFCFGFSFSPADLKHRNLNLACIPEPLQNRWSGAPNLVFDVPSPNLPGIACSYLLGLPKGDLIGAFAEEAELAPPGLQELATYERLAKDWENKENLDFEGWASLVLGLVSIAPQPNQAVRLKQMSVNQAVSRLRTDIADDILCLRGFKRSALGDATNPIGHAVSDWFRKSFSNKNQKTVSAVAEVLKKINPGASGEWAQFVIEGAKSAFASIKQNALEVIWEVWSVSEEIFDVVPPKIFMPSCEENDWVDSTPLKLPQRLGSKLLNWCRNNEWWQLHASSALAFMPWENALKCQLSAGGMNTNHGVRFICGRGDSSALALFAVKTESEEVRDCAAERCAGSPETFELFDPLELGWLDLLERTIVKRPTLPDKIASSGTMLLSLLDIILAGTPVSESILNSFLDAGHGDLILYDKRVSLWAKLPVGVRDRFLKATALGWFTRYFETGGALGAPEASLRAVLFSPELRALRFLPEMKNLVATGLMLFESFPDAPEDVFEEWLDAVAISSAPVSIDESRQIVETIGGKNWDDAARTIENLAEQSENSNLQRAWEAYWSRLKRQERIFWRVERMFRGSKVIAPLRLHSPNKTKKAKSVMSEKTTALFLTALGLEFNAVKSHLTDVEEKTIDHIVYATGIFRAGMTDCLVAIAQSGAGNVEAATLTERAIKNFSPGYAFFVGIAGCLRTDLNIGDVIAADKIYAYESGKAEIHFKVRPKAPLADFASLQRANATARSMAWIKRITPTPKLEPKAYVKPIAAGEKVIDSHYSDAFKLIKESYGDAYAVAMEEFGFYYALHVNPSVTGAVIRGISDFAENKSQQEKMDSQNIAARHAAAFAFEMLEGFLSAGQEPR